MKRAASGFTLIELMIVVAIIGILAALALPAYLDYAARAKVSESASASAEARLAVVLAYNEGRLSETTDNAALGLVDAAAFASKYVESITVVGVSATAGTVTVKMRGTNKSDIDGKTVVFTITCDSTCKTVVDGEVPVKYLPKA